MGKWEFVVVWIYCVFVGGVGCCSCYGVGFCFCVVF